MRPVFPALLIVSSVIFFSCKDQQDEKPDFLAANMDTTINPADNFFLYANGSWIKNNAIPQEEGSWGIGNLVQEEIYTRLRKINEEAGKEKASNGTVTQKIADFWLSGMDSLELEKQGLKPLEEDLHKIDAIQNTNDLVNLTAAFHVKGVNVLFGDYVGQDNKHSDVMAYHLWQGGIGMPNRDYYFNKDARSEGVRKAYKNYVFKTYRQLGSDSLEAGKKTDLLFKLETKLAASSRKLEDLRDPYKNYNKMHLNGLHDMATAIPWPAYFQQIGMKQVDSIIVGQPEFFTALNAEVKNTSLEEWKNYLRFHLVRSSAPYLDKDTYANYFDYRKTLTGAKQPRPRWKRVIDMEEDAMGEALGQLFVKEYFNGKAKKRYNDLVESVRSAYKERIEKLSWMSDSTKQKALFKLAKVSKKVGYPEKWKDFSSLTIDRGPLLWNVQRANIWWHNYELNKLGKPVDRTEWDMSPQTYNAYYNPSNNEIVLPAGIFAVPGMRDEDLDDAFVYGYAGASTIGHEITHGFDDEGRQFDFEGNLKNWWQGADEKQFSSRAEKIISQFSAFNPVDTLHVNGKATQGENIADLGGLLIALDAFKKTDNYKHGQKIGGLTPLQRYFLGYAYGWMSQSQKERLANQVITDVHAPAQERVNGPMANIPEFYEAFGIKPGSKMYSADSARVNIW